MVQAVTGDDYDSLCDGTYDAKVDVPPFVPALDDPFGGTADAWPDPTEGSRGGLGFRGDGSVPFVVLVTDRASRDADSTDRDLGTTPGGCPDDAGLSDVYAAFVAEGAVPIVAVVTTVPGGGETEGYERLAAQVALRPDHDPGGSSRTSAVRSPPEPTRAAPTPSTWRCTAASPRRATSRRSRSC